VRQSGIMPAVRRAVRSLIAIALLGVVAPTGATAQTTPPIPLPIPGGNLPTPPPVTAPIFGPFRSVLAQGEGQSASAGDLAANQANGSVPDTFTNQQPLYVGIMPNASTLVPADLDTYYKRTDFGQMPGDVASYSEPRPGAKIFRDRAYGMAHIFGDNRYDLMFATGYATAQERLFLMDALRRTAEGRLAGLTGASAAHGDAVQLTDQDFSPEELTKQFEALPKRFGAEGQRVHDDIQAYVDGINARIDEVNNDPSQLPAEYPALGTTPAHWTVADTAAEATLLVTQFTVSNGSEEVNALLQEAFKKRFGKKTWRKRYHDFREAQDPEALTVARQRFNSDNPGKVKPGLNAMPDFGSVKPHDALSSGPSAQQQQAAAANAPAWVRSINNLKASLPHVESNAVMVSKKLTQDGHPLAAFGPQVSYYSPQIFSEYELHGGGIDVEGVAFPGAAPYPLIGHGIDFAWSGTSANGDNNDTFVELLCNTDGSAPTEKSTAYMYKGKCRPFTSREQQVTTPTAPTSPSPPQTITYKTLRSVHGPVFKLGTVGGKPVAFTKAKGVDFHELDAALPFMRMAENHPRSAKQFQKDFSVFPGTENWFYVDSRNVAFQQSGLFPKHARGTDVDLPYWGDGRADWQGFKPSTYTFKTIPASHRPRALDPKQGYFISWNNKEAPGWRKGPSEWGDGPVHRALILHHKLLAQKKKGPGGKLDLTALTRAVNLAATTDLRGDEDYVWMRRVIGKAPAADERYLKLLDAWHRSGSQRLDANGDNVYDHSAAVALMDAWWPRAVRGEFRPALGTTLFSKVVSDVLGLGGFNDWAWATHVQKDLRDVLRAPERGRYSRLYCGGPSRAGARARCRTVLLASLRAAVGDVTKKYGSGDTAQWKVPATCAKASPPACDQIVPNTAGAIDTPPFPWQNRGTYHQVVELSRHR
jgi:acyl-homoserine lactone acylase PvdQ